MKKSLGLLISFLAVILTDISCKKDDGSAILPPEAEQEYYTVPFSITIGITQNTGSADGVEYKQAFADGDVVEITNPQVLYEPLNIAVGSNAGKSSATFDVDLRVKNGAKLVSGSTKFTAMLKNGTKYNQGKPFVDVKPVESLADGLDRYSCWGCENFTYSSSNTSISLVQNTVFVDVHIPFLGAYIVIHYGNAEFSDMVFGNKMFAVPFGSKIECGIMNLSQSLDVKNKILYSVSATIPDECLPSLFSVAEDRQVFFSKGNLQYRPMDGAWRLASQQYDFCFWGMSLIRSEDIFGVNYANWQGEDKWTDYFLWGSWVVGGSPNLLLSEPINNTPPLDADGNLVNNCAYGAGWSVLNNDEWTYLMDIRPDAHQKRGGALIDGKYYGYIILPDDWTTPVGVPPLVSNYKVSEVNKVPNHYSLEEWIMMEAAGALFLPQIGRLSDNCTRLNLAGIYYSSRSNTHELGHALYVYIVDNTNYKFVQKSEYYPVRLVHDINIEAKVE